MEVFLTGYMRDLESFRFQKRPPSLSMVCRHSRAPRIPGPTFYDVIERKVFFPVMACHPYELHAGMIALFHQFVPNQGSRLLLRIIPDDDHVDLIGIDICQSLLDMAVLCSGDLFKKRPPSSASDFY